MSTKTKTIIIASLLLCMVVAITAKVLIRRQSISARDACIANLRQIDAAIRRWDLDRSNANMSTPKNYDSVTR
jgi:hypothetical protein